MQSPPDVSNPQGIRQRVKGYLAQNRISQRDLAARAGIDEARLSMALSGKRPITADPLLSGLARVLNTTTEELRVAENDFRTWLQSPAGQRASRLERFAEERDHLNLASGGTPLVDRLLRGMIETREIGLWEEVDGIRRDCGVSEHMIQPASLDLGRGFGKWLGGCHRAKRCSAEIGRERVEILPDDRLLLRTRETISLPPNVLGRVGAMGDLIQHGIQVSFGLHLDPGWSGQPFVLLHHIGDYVVDETGRECGYTLDFGEPFLSVELEYLPISPDAPHPSGITTTGST